MSAVEHVLSLNHSIGEGPLWHPVEQALYWCVIDEDTFYRWKPGSETVERLKTPYQIGCFGFHEDGAILLATRIGFVSYRDGDSRPFEDNIAYRPASRFNDGAVDRAGRFWAGTTNDKPENHLYCMDLDGSVTIREEGVSVSNGIGWSPDSKTMYYSDSSAETVGIIYAYDFDLVTGGLSNRRIFFKSDSTHGFPDGLTVDAMGGIWCAFWDGSKVVQFSPDGRMVDEIRLPVRRPTSCCFGGEHLDELYITSAAKEQDLSVYPLAGDIFRVRMAVRGIPEPMSGIALSGR